MSSDSQPDFGPRVAPRANSAIGRRTLGGSNDIFESYWSRTFDGQRSLYESLGYIKEPEYRHYLARYQRLDEAKALVDKLPQKAWQTPEITDSDDETDDPTEFEAAVQDFLNGEATRQDPIDVCQRASRMERLGQYSVIFLGLTDDGVADGNEESLANPVSESMDGLDGIQYLSPYDEGRVDPDGISLVEDVTDPRYGLPESYNVDLGDNRPTVTIHHDRVVHIVGSTFDEELQSDSVLKRSLNRLDDIAKIHGSAAEAFWRTAYQGFFISPPTIDGTPAQFGDDGSKEALADQIDEYHNNFRRAIFANGEVQTLDADTQDPTGHLESQYRALAAGHDIPQSVLMGNETGERATQEDRALWHERIGEYREEFCAPRVLRPLLDKLIQFGILPEPRGGPQAYDIEWPALEEPSEQEIAETEKLRAETASKLNIDTAAKVEYVEDAEFPERARETGEETMSPAGSLAIDESDPRVVEQFAGQGQGDGEAQAPADDIPPNESGDSA